MKIVNITQMQKAERDCSKFGISLYQLMENAGRAVAEESRQIIGNIEKQNILGVAGPGNNGGDGLVAARYFHDWGATVNVYICGKRAENDTNLDQLIKRSINHFQANNDAGFSCLNSWLSVAGVVLDAVFGTGKSRPITGEFTQVLTIIRETKKKRDRMLVIALDLPSGLNADTGDEDPSNLPADYTITLAFPKIGLFNLSGIKKAGKIIVADIGIPENLVDYVKYEYVEKKWIRSILPPRPPTSHKGTFGKVLAYTGSINYPGAAFLACNGSLRVGAGLTTLVITKSLLPILASKLTEVTYLPLPELSYGIVSEEATGILTRKLPDYDVLLIGCGLGQNLATVNLVKSILIEYTGRLPPVVLDADGLNSLVKIPEWQTRFKGNAVFTPHAGEMSRLLDESIEYIQNNRLEITRQAAIAWGKTVVLKGAYTIIASPEGYTRVSPFSNSGLSSAGTGDVLAGVIAGFVAQGLSPFDAASCGVYLHGFAGEMVKSEIGDAGLLASDLLPLLPRAIRQLKEV